MNQKNNQRFQDNEAAIETAFLELLKEKKAEKISVREICERAGLNRSTFYHHYPDILDLMDRIERKIQLEFVSSLPESDIIRTALDPAYVTQALRHIKKYPEFYREYLNTRQNRAMREYTHLWESYFVPMFRHHGISDEHKMRYYLDFFSCGCMQVFRDWLENDCLESPEELTDLILVFLPTFVPAYTEEQSGEQ